MNEGKPIISLVLELVFSGTSNTRQNYGHLNLLETLHFTFIKIIPKH